MVVTNRLPTLGGSKIDDLGDRMVETQVLSIVFQTYLHSYSKGRASKSHKSSIQKRSVAGRT